MLYNVQIDVASLPPGICFGDGELPEVLVFTDTNSLARAAADQFISLAVEAIETNGVFTTVLSGGSTPHTMYQILATEPYSKQVNLSKFHFFWGDERSVPPDYPDSNYFHAKKTLLDKIPIPDTNVHRILAEKPPAEAADSYEEMLLEFFQSHPGAIRNNCSSFDLVLLGMGEDGHTASLFPNSEVIHESTRWVSAVYAERLGAWRITMTPLLLNKAAQVIFLVTGSNKNWTLQKVLYGAYQPDRYPAQIIQPDSGKVLWLLDRAAAIFTA